MREVGLINVALPNVVDDSPHPGAVLGAGEGGGDRVRFRLAKRGRGRLRLAKRGEVFGPKLDGGLRALGASVALLIQPGGDQPHLAELMIEHDEAVVKSDAALRQLEVIQGGQRQSWLDELFQLVTEVSEATTKRKGEVDLLEQLVAIGQALEQFPRVAKQRVLSGVSANDAARAERFEPKKRPGRNEAEPIRMLHRTGAQQDGAERGVQPSGQRFRRVPRFNLLNERRGHRGAISALPLFVLFIIAVHFCAVHSGLV